MPAYLYSSLEQDCRPSLFLVNLKNSIWITLNKRRIERKVLLNHRDSVNTLFVV